MRLPARDGKPNEERKRRRRTAHFVNDNLPRGDIKNEEMDEVALMRQNKLARFSYHKRVADYLLGRSVGEGSFAKVRLGLHAQTAEEVAIKIVSKARARKDAYVHKNLRREGRILQMARHKNIVQIYDVLETDNNYYLVTEFCGGGELIDIVSDKGCLPEHDVRRYVAQLVSAVTHLHDNGIVHRDLKVENLLLDDHGEIKIIDFGLSNVVPPNHTNPAVALATQCGSPAYAAPELLAKNKYGYKVDVWSIGVITYALLVGKLPFTVEPFRITKLCRKMLLGDMNPIPSHLSGNCRHFIRLLLVADPDMRPSIAEVGKMPWISFAGKSSSLWSLGKSRDEIYSTIDIDLDVALEMTSKLGFEYSNILHFVRKNRPGEALTTYNLLLKQKTRLRDSGLNLRRHGDVIGSDGNLDRENKSDKGCEEKRPNVADDVRADVMRNGDVKDSFEAPVDTPNAASERDENEAQHCNIKFVNELIEKRLQIRIPNDPEESLKHHDNNSPKNLTLHDQNSAHVSQCKPNDKKPGADVDNTFGCLEKMPRRIEDYLKLQKNDTDERENIEANLATDSPNPASLSTLPELKSESGSRGAAKLERKSRGPASMRELMKTMSRAKEALQKRSIFGQNKTNRESRKNNSGNTELSRFRRLVSKNNGMSDETSDEKSGFSAYGGETFQSDDKLWKNYVPNGSHPVRVKLPEVTPPATPSTVDGRSSNAYSNHKTPRATVLHTGRASLLSKTSGAGDEAGLDGYPALDYSNRRLPQISPERNQELLRNPLHCDNLTPRHPPSFSSCNSSSKETRISDSEASGVKRMVDIFQSLMNNADQRTCANSRQQVFHPASPRLRDTSAASNLSVQRRRRDDAALEIRPSSTKTTGPNTTPALNATSNGVYSVFRQSSTLARNYRITPRNSMDFPPHFIGDKQDLQTNGKKSASSDVPKYRSASRGIWYKSAV